MPQIERIVIDHATNGDNTLRAADELRVITVLSLALVPSADVTVRLESGAGGTALTGQMVMAAKVPFVLPHNDHGWVQTKRGELLNMELNGAVSVDGVAIVSLD